MPLISKSTRTYYSSLFELLAKWLITQSIVRKFYTGRYSTLLEFPFDEEFYAQKPLIETPLILITEVQRSGGSLLSQLFDGHPEIYGYPSELLFVKNSWPVATFKGIKENVPNAGNLLLQNKLFQKYVWFGYNKASKSQVQSKKYLFTFRFDIEKFLLDFHMEKQTKLATLSNRNICDAYFTAFFHSWLNFKQDNQRKKKYIAAFAPRTNIDLVFNNEAMESFAKTYPDGFIISLIRPPLDWYASAVKHSKNYADFNQAIEIWKLSTEATIALSVQENVIPILFNDLVLHTESIMRRICEKTGLQFDPTLCDPTFNGELIKANSSFARNQKRGVDASVIGGGKNLANYSQLMRLAEEKE